MNRAEIEQLVDEAVVAGVATGLARRKVADGVASASVAEAVEVGLAVRARAGRSPWGRLLEGVELAVPAPAAVQRVTAPQTLPAPAVALQPPAKALHEMDAGELVASGKTALNEVLVLTEVASAVGQIRENAARHPTVEPGVFAGRSTAEIEQLLDSLGLPRQ